MKTLSIVLFLFGVLCVIQGYPNGAPTTSDSCLNLQPIHTDPISGQRFPNQDDPAPFRIEVSTGVYQPCVMPIDCRRAPITVTIRGLSMYFRGFIIQARTQFGGVKSHGQFLRSADGSSDRFIKQINCQNGPTLTHTSSTDQSSIRFQWIPEPNMKEPVQFVSTIVQNVRTIYTNVRSTEVTAVGETRTNTKATQTINRLQPVNGNISPAGSSQMFILHETPHDPFDYSWRNNGQILAPSIQQQKTVAIGQIINTGAANSQKSVNMILGNGSPNSQILTQNNNARHIAQLPGSNTQPNVLSNQNNLNAQGPGQNTNGVQFSSGGTSFNSRQSSNVAINRIPTAQSLGINGSFGSQQQNNRRQDLQMSSSGVNSQRQLSSGRPAQQVGIQQPAGLSANAGTNTITANNQPMNINSVNQQTNNKLSNQPLRTGTNNVQNSNSVPSNSNIQTAQNMQPNNNILMNGGIPQMNSTKLVTKNNQTLVVTVTSSRLKILRNKTTTTLPPTTKFIRQFTTIIPTSVELTTTKPLPRLSTINNNSVPKSRSKVNSPVFLQKQDGDFINSSTKPKNSAYQIATSFVLMALPLILLLL